MRRAGQNPTDVEVQSLGLHRSIGSQRNRFKTWWTRSTMAPECLTLKTSSRWYCKYLPSIFRPSKRQIALYSPCRSVSQSVGVTIKFPSPNVFLHFLLGFSFSPEQNKNKNNNNDYLYGPAPCKRSYGWSGLLQMIMHMDRPLANDLPDWPTSCKWSSGWTGLLQTIIRMEWPLANDHQDGAASCKW